MNGIRPTVGIEFDDIQKAKLAQEFITSYSAAISFEQFVSYMKNGGIK